MMLIRNERECKEALVRLAALQEQVRGIRARLAERGVVGDALALATAAQEVMADEFEWDIRLYQRLKAGEIEAIPEFAPEERGKALICLRLVKGWSQRQLADALGVSEAVLLRDEHNEYRGISLEKYGKVLHALGFEDHPRFVATTGAQVFYLRAPVIPNAQIYRLAASFIPTTPIAIHAEPAHA